MYNSITNYDNLINPINVCVVDTKWYIRDIYSDMHAVFTDYILDDLFACNKLDVDWQNAVNNPIKPIVKKLNNYRFDIPIEAYDVLQKLLNMLLEVPSYNDVISWSDLNADYNETDQWLIDPMHNKQFKLFYQFALEEGINIYSDHKYLVWRIVNKYHQKMFDEFNEYAENNLRKFFE